MKYHRCCILLAALALAPKIALGETCSPPIEDALRLMLVSSPTMNTHRARVQYFTRNTPRSSWQQTGTAEPAVIGNAGLAWGVNFHSFKNAGEPEKVEGDKRTPAGIFHLGPSFGFLSSNTPGHIVIKPGETVCVEDSTSPHYNTITTRAAIGYHIKIDEMARTPLYRIGLFINYPTDRARRRGSCVFVHIWSGSGRGTAGCVALPEDRVGVAQAFSRPGRAVIAILPDDAISRFGNCLPQLQSNSLRQSPASK